MLCMYVGTEKACTCIVHTAKEGEIWDLVSGYGWGWRGKKQKRSCAGLLQVQYALCHASFFWILYIQLELIYCTLVEQSTVGVPVRVAEELGKGQVS